MLETKNVFIDTECYVRTKLNLNNPTFNTFRELCASRELNHVITSTVKLEVMRKISDSITGAVNVLQKFQRQAQILNSLQSVELKPLFESIEESDVVTIAEQVFIDFLEECFTETANADEIDGEDILARYFARRAPFNKDKDNEFRDSISLMSLKKWLENEGNEKAYVVSGDKALEEFCKDEDNLIYINNLGHMLDLYNQHNDKRTETIKEYLNKQNQQIKNQIEDYLNECEIYNNSSWEDSEVDYFTVVEVEDFEASIIHIDDEECQVVIDVNVIFEVSVTGPDYTNGIYDKESGRTYSFSDKTQVCNVKLDFDVDINITFELYDGQLRNIESNDLHIHGVHSGIEIEIEENIDDINY